MNKASFVTDLLNKKSKFSPEYIIYSQEWGNQGMEIPSIFPSKFNMITFGQSESVSKTSYSDRLTCSPCNAKNSSIVMEESWVHYYTGGKPGLPKGAILDEMEEWKWYTC
ncbi:MAG: hypothetical protein H8E56_06030 [Candidatus Marinimicrobia bacterium]|nr:hypothetical protein [Candidatus Neomarinimicrobiota bacterium]